MAGVSNTVKGAADKWLYEVTQGLWMKKCQLKPCEFADRQYHVELVSPNHAYCVACQYHIYLSTDAEDVKSQFSKHLNSGAHIMKKRNWSDSTIFQKSNGKWRCRICREEVEPISIPKTGETLYDKIELHLGTRLHHKYNDIFTNRDLWILMGISRTQPFLELFLHMVCKICDKKMNSSQAQMAHIISKNHLKLFEEYLKDSFQFKGSSNGELRSFFCKVAQTGHWKMTKIEHIVEGDESEVEDDHDLNQYSVEQTDDPFDVSNFPLLSVTPVQRSNVTEDTPSNSDCYFETKVQQLQSSYPGVEDEGKKETARQRRSRTRKRSHNKLKLEEESLNGVLQFAQKVAMSLDDVCFQKTNDSEMTHVELTYDMIPVVPNSEAEKENLGIRASDAPDFDTDTSVIADLTTPEIENDENASVISLCELENGTLEPEALVVTEELPSSEIEVSGGSNAESTVLEIVTNNVETGTAESVLEGLFTNIQNFVHKLTPSEYKSAVSGASIPSDVQNAIQGTSQAQTETADPVYEELPTNLVTLPETETASSDAPVPLAVQNPVRDTSKALAETVESFSEELSAKKESAVPSTRLSKNVQIKNQVTPEYENLRQPHPAEMVARQPMSFKRDNSYMDLINPFHAYCYACSEHIYSRSDRFDVCSFFEQHVNDKNHQEQFLSPSFEMFQLDTENTLGEDTWHCNGCCMFLQLEPKTETVTLRNLVEKHFYSAVHGRNVRKAMIKDQPHEVTVVALESIRKLANGEDNEVVSENAVESPVEAKNPIADTAEYKLIPLDRRFTPKTDKKLYTNLSDAQISDCRKFILMLYHKDRPLRKYLIPPKLAAKRLVYSEDDASPWLEVTPRVLIFCISCYIMVLFTEGDEHQKSDAHAKEHSKLQTWEDDLLKRLDKTPYFKALQPKSTDCRLCRSVPHNIPKHNLAMSEHITINLQTFFYNLDDFDEQQNLWKKMYKKKVK